MVLDDRKKAQESKFFHDADQQFKLVARTRKKLGLWAAEKLGKKDKDAYAVAIVMDSVGDGGEDAAVETISADFAKADITIDVEKITEKRNELMEQEAQAMND